VKGVARFLLPALGGCILTLAFAPYKLSLLAWIAFIPLFYSLRDGRYPFWKAFLMGLAFFATLLYWIPFSNVEKSVLPQMITGYLLLLFYLSCYFGLSGLFYNKLRKLSHIEMFPFVFTGLEFIRSLSSNLGFPWGSVGYSQGNLIHFVQIASLGGLPLVTFWVLSMNTILYLFIENWIIKRKSRRLYLYLTLGFIIFPFLYSEIVLYRGYKSEGNLTATIIQPNILPTEKRWRSNNRLEKIREIVKSLPESDIYILPETASPYSLANSEKTKRFFQDLAKEKDGLIITGMPDFEVKDVKILYYNAAVLVDSEKIVGIYRKMFLVPFVERLPFDDIIPGFAKINLGQGHFSPGSNYSVFDAGENKISVFICYEAIFPQIIRKFVLGGTHLLVNITEDGWFGKTSAPYQHAQMAAFQSIAYRRTLLRSANTGVSLIISPFGRIILKSKIYRECSLTAKIPLVKGKTVYAKIGDTFGWLFLLFVLGLIFYRRTPND